MRDKILSMCPHNYYKCIAFWPHVYSVRLISFAVDIPPALVFWEDGHLAIILVDQHNHNNHSNCGKGGQNRLESPNWSVRTCSNKSDNEGLVCTGTLVSFVEKKSLFWGRYTSIFTHNSTNGTQSLLFTAIFKDRQHPFILTSIANIPSYTQLYIR